MPVMFVCLNGINLLKYLCCNALRRDAGIGRQDGLKNHCSQGREGSSPSLGRI